MFVSNKYFENICVTRQKETQYISDNDKKIIYANINDSFIPFDFNHIVLRIR